MLLCLTFLSEIQNPIQIYLPINTLVNQVVSVQMYQIPSFSISGICNVPFKLFKETEQP